MSVPVTVVQLLRPEFWGRWVAIMVLNLTLSGDNAVVIALAVRNLPGREAWRGRLWGTVGAVVLRVLFTGLVAAVLGFPLLQAFGGLVLVWIAFRLLAQDGGEPESRQGASLLEAVWIIIVADLVMSLDNVLAVAAAAQGNALLIVLGVGLSIPIVIWGAGILARLMGRMPWLVDLGAGILGWVAGEMITRDRLVATWLTPADAGPGRWAVSAALAVGVVGGARLLARRRSRRPERRAAGQR